MAIIKTRLPGFNGYRASVLFKNSVGETDDTRLIEWFRSRGYIVEDEKPTNATEKQTSVKVEEETIESEVTVETIETMSVDKLRAYAKNHKIFVGNIKDRDKLIAKIKEVM